MKVIEKIKLIPITKILQHFEIIGNNIDKKFKCPFHQGKSLSSCKTFLKINKIKCFSECNRTFDIFDLIKKYKETNFKNSINYILKNFSIQKNELLSAKPIINCEKSITVNSNSKKKTNQIEFENEKYRIQHEFTLKNQKTFLLIQDYFHYCLLNNKKALKFLAKERQINLTTIKELKLGFAPIPQQNNEIRLLNKFILQKISFQELTKFGFIKQNKDFFKNRIMIPITQNIKNKEIPFDFYGRAIGLSKIKYLSLQKNFDSKIFLFPFQFQKNLQFIKESKKMILHEGFFETIVCNQFGIKNAVSLGNINNNFSLTLLNFFKKCEIEVIIGLDSNDETGFKKSQILSTQLKENEIQHSIKFIPKQLSCKDADELIRKHGISTYKQIYLN